MFAVPIDDEKRLLGELDARTDIEAGRMKRYLAMPDLSRTPGSPLHEIVERVTSLPALKNFDHIQIPEVVPTDILFDLFDFAPNHPARSKSDTYYVDDKNVLRTHDTVMWYYYMQLPEIKKKIAEKKPLGVMCYGKVFRKDEIDRKHMNIFHQMGGLFMVPDDMEQVPIDELRTVLTQVVEGIFGKETYYRFLPDTFPYTNPSLQVEVWIGPGKPSTESSDDVGPDGGRWIEILGGGMPKKTVMKNFGVEGYNGWAFGFGLERLAIIGLELPDIRLLWSTDERVTKQLKLGQKFVEVSKYPPIVRDISFIVSKDVALNNYFDLVRDVVGDLAEEVKLLDTYGNAEKFGANNVSYAFRITYRSLDRTLTTSEIDALHKKLEDITVKTFGAKVR